MKCKKVHPHLKDYLNQKLDSRMHTAISAHLETCPDCRRELSFIKNYLQALAVLPPQNAPAALLSRVEANLNESPKRAYGYLRLLYSASGLIVAVTAVWLTMLNFNTVHLIDQKKDNTIMIGKAPLPSPKVVDSEFTEPAPTESRYPGFTESASKKSESPLKPNAKVERKERPVAAKPESEILLRLRVAQEIVSNLETAPANRRLMLGKAKSMAPAEFSADQELKPEIKGEIPEPDGSDGSMVENIRKIVETNQGKILKEEYDAATGRVSQITTTVPAENYRQFLEDLKKVSDLQPAGPEKPQTAGMQQIRLAIEYRQ
jgi:hypothetical protein